MDAEFWHDKWKTGEIGFHEGQPNALLVKHIAKLNLPKTSRIFLPLCGKSKDIAWLLAQGYRVVGAELSELAVEDLFNDMGITADVRLKAHYNHYSAANIDIYVGDIFDLTPTELGEVHAIYDRAALVALPEALRLRYTQHLIALTRKARQLLIAFEYDQAVMAGPPFHISADEIAKHYQTSYRIDFIERAPVKGGLKGKVPADEVVWLLQSQ